MRIAMIIARFTPAIGGLEVFCERLSKCLVTRGHDVIILTERFQPGLPETETFSGVRLFRLNTDHPGALATFLFITQAIRRLAREPRRDILHAYHLSSPSLVAMAAQKILGISAIVQVGGARAQGDVTTSRATAQGRLKLRLFKAWAPPIVCPSPETIQEMREIGMRPEQIHQIPNAVDTTYFHPANAEERAAARAQLGIPANRRVALSVGRWIPQKGLHKLLQIWREAIQKNDSNWDLQLVIPGGAEVTAEIQAATRDLGSRVRWAVNVPDVRPYYLASDCAVLLSEGEGLSLFLLEAMASGLPTITTEAAAVAEPDQAQAWGRVISRGADLTKPTLDALQELGNSPEILQSLGAAARRKSMDYDMDSVTGMFEQLYLETSRASSKAA